MSAFEQAKAALAAAKADQDAKRRALEEATANLADLTAKAKSGQGTADDLAKANAAVEHARLVYDGAAANIPALAAAVKDARANQACDETLADLALVDQDFAPIREAIEAHLPALVEWVERRNTVVEAAIHRLEKVALNPEPAYEGSGSITTYRRGGTASSPFVAGAEEPGPPPPEPAPAAPSRFKYPRHNVPTVDRVPLNLCRGDYLLSAIALPYYRQLGVSEGSLESYNLKLSAGAAPQIPAS